MSFKSLSERVKIEVKARTSKKVDSSDGLDDSNLQGLHVRSKDDGKTWTVVAAIQKDGQTFFKLTAPGLPDENGTPGPTEKLVINKKELKGKYDLA
jgi:hypothetical protein